MPTPVSEPTEVCGIYGVVDPNGLPDSAVFAGMDRLIHHRGPDDSGLFLEAPVALGARRLAILDLSDAGHQPMHSPDGRFVLVYNGEVYNHSELRDELAAKGRVFHSRTDTEVVLAAFEAWGPAALERLSGMLALACWDRERQELWLARDRFGIKPLYWYQDGSRLAFASELKALLSLPGVDRGLDADALGLYLTLGYVPGPRTVFARIRKAAPATVYRFAAGHMDAHSYWRLREEPMEPTSPLEQLEVKLRDVMERHLVSDVPLGVFLSGGVDSTSLVIAIRKLLDRPVRSFTIGFGDPAWSEIEPARAVARALDTEHHELVLEPDAVEVLPRILWHLEEPVADTSILPLWFLCEMAASDVTVALAGDGGDETFGGYPRYRWEPVAEAYAHLPGFLRQGLLPALATKLPRGQRRGAGNIVRRVRKFLDTGRLARVPRYLSWFELFTLDARAHLMPDARGDAVAFFEDWFRASGAVDPLRQLQYVDTRSMLVDDLLLKADKLSMAHSLELRVPFLDPGLAEFAYNLPRHWKLAPRGDKRLLRRWLRSRAPSHIARRPKRGFEVPIGAWFRGKLSHHAREVLLGGELRKRGILAPEATGALLEQHQRGRGDHGTQLFALVVLEHFCRVFDPGDLV